jgi:uncharacterized protein
MLYFDTNFLVPLVRREPNTDRIAEFVEGLPKEQLAISHWARVELTSVLGRLVRMGELDHQEAVAADTRFETMVAGAFTVLTPTAADHELAKTYLKYFAIGLRAGDALHLAIASNNRARAIFTLDKVALAAGVVLGLPTNRGIAE